MTLDNNDDHALTKVERMMFETLLSACVTSALREMPEGHDVALMRVMLDGEPASVVAVVSPVNPGQTEGDDLADVRPLALLVGDDLFERITPPVPDALVVPPSEATMTPLRSVPTEPETPDIQQIVASLPDDHPDLAGGQVLVRSFDDGNSWEVCTRPDHYSTWSLGIEAVTA